MGLIGTIYRMERYVVVNCTDRDELMDILYDERFPTDAVVLTPELVMQYEDGVFERSPEVARSYFEKNAPVPKEVYDISREKNLTLFLGTARQDGDELYNSLVCIKDGEEVWHHDKFKLYTGSNETKVFKAPEGWEGNMELDGVSYSTPICIETNHIMRKGREKSLYSDVADFNPDIMLVPAYWPNSPDLFEGNLRTIMRRTGAKMVLFANGGNRSGGMYLTESGGSSIVMENGTCRLDETGWIEIEADLEKSRYVNTSHLLEKED